MSANGAYNDEPKKAVQQARNLRKQDVPAETFLWKALRNRALGGFKFRRQHPISRYIADFACVECQLVVELDGISHLSAKAADDERTQFISGEGWQVIRFWNNEVFDDLDPVKEAIYAECVRLSKR